jgi:hypothetical protein
MGYCYQDMNIVISPLGIEGNREGFIYRVQFSLDILMYIIKSNLLIGIKDISACNWACCSNRSIDILEGLTFNHLEGLIYKGEKLKYYLLSSKDRVNMYNKLIKGSFLNGFTITLW